MTSKLVGLLAGRPVLRQVIWPLATFFAIAIASILAFMALGDVGILEALFWLIDPTSIELHFQQAPGPERATKLVAVLSTSGLVLATLWAGETVLSATLGGQISQEIQKAQEERRIMETQDHVIVCGYGMFGRTVARGLTEDGREVIVVEIDQDHVDQARQDGFLAVAGDARKESVLKKTEVGAAQGLVAAVDDSNVNIQVAIVASELAPELEITVRVGDEMYESLARRAGADHVVIPEIMTGEVIAERMRDAWAPVRR